MFLTPLNGGPGIALGSGPIFIGRHHGCDIRVLSPRVSRRHCCLTVGSDGVLVCDLGSTNGTRINGRRVASGRLRPGDALELGDVCYRLAETDGDRPEVGHPAEPTGHTGPTLS